MEYLKVGKILNTRGIKGELKIRSETDFQEDRFQSGNRVFIYYQGSYLEVSVLKYRNINNQDYLIFNNYEDINLVEKFKGCEIFVPYEDEMTLYEDEYHISEIIGMQVYQNGIRVGEVVDVKAYPQGDYLEVIQESGKHSFIPFRDEFVPTVDIDDNRIDIIDMEGLL